MPLFNREIYEEWWHFQLIHCTCCVRRRHKSLRFDSIASLAIVNLTRWKQLFLAVVDLLIDVPELFRAKTFRPLQRPQH